MARWTATEIAIGIDRAIAITATLKWENEPIVFTEHINYNGGDPV